MTTTAIHTDESVIDAIATLLGTNPDWDGGGVLEDIADLVGYVRPLPGDVQPYQYRDAFEAATGRPVPAAWDIGDA